MTDNREWLAPKLLPLCPQGHFPALRADLCGSHRYNRSEFRRRGPGVHCHGRKSCHDNVSFRHTASECQCRCRYSNRDGGSYSTCFHSLLRALNLRAATSATTPRNVLFREKFRSMPSSCGNQWRERLQPATVTHRGGTINGNSLLNFRHRNPQKRRKQIPAYRSPATAWLPKAGAFTCHGGSRHRDQGICAICRIQTWWSEIMFA
jgi:hypothetical protein